MSLFLFIGMMKLFLALIDDEETQAAIKQVLFKLGRTAVGVVRFKKKEKGRKTEFVEPDVGAATGQPETESEEEEEGYMVSVGEQLDMIGDGEDDLSQGTFDIDDEEETQFLVSPEDDIELDDYKDRSMYDPYYGDDDESDFEEDLFGGDFDDEEKGNISFKIHESLDMFNRIKKYN